MLVTEGLWVPLVHIQGVYILPGIPRLFQQMLTHHQARFNGPPFLSAALYTHMGEGDLAGERCFQADLLWTSLISGLQRSVRQPTSFQCGAVPRCGIRRSGR